MLFLCANTFVWSHAQNQRWVGDVLKWLLSTSTADHAQQCDSARQVQRHLHCAAAEHEGPDIFRCDDFVKAICNMCLMQRRSGFLNFSLVWWVSWDREDVGQDGDTMERTRISAPYGRYSSFSSPQDIKVSRTSIHSCVCMCRKEWMCCCWFSSLFPLNFRPDAGKSKKQKQIWVPT